MLGDSIPFWAGTRAVSTGKADLKLDGRTIAWWGVRGLRWSDFRRSVQSQVLLSPSPSVIVLHLGGNDLHELSICKIKRCMTAEVKYLREAFPGAVIIWVDILPRRCWKGAWTLNQMETKRKRVNRLGRCLVKKTGRSDIVCPDIDLETNFFRADGVHLNDVGLEFYLDYLRDSLKKNL